jgi:cobalamin biosynthesis protein CobC
MLEHGGNLWKASRMYGIPRHAWIDLSTGINPHSLLATMPPPALWRDLPQTLDLLEQTAAEYYDADNLCAVAGSQAAIQWLPALRQRFFGLSNVAVPAVGFAEHRRCWGLWHDTRTWTAADIDRILPDVDVLVVINPNNPTGERFSQDQLLAWHEQLAARDGWLIVDEAYMDTTPEQSLAAVSDRAGLFVLRSLGKFFGLGGIRVGFTLGEREMISALEELMGPWSIASPSRWIAEHALRDKAWQSAMRVQLEAESTELEAILRHVFPNESIAGTHLFKTLWLPQAQELYQHLAQQGILVRLTDEGTAVRVGLPGDDSQWTALSKVLRQFQA